MSLDSIEHRNPGSLLSAFSCIFALAIRYCTWMISRRRVGPAVCPFAIGAAAAQYAPSVLPPPSDAHTCQLIEHVCRCAPTQEGCAAC